MKLTQTVWVVDDDASIAWVLEKALSKQGYKVETFNGVKPMLTALKLARPDVVISDIQMPGVDGLKLLALLQENFPSIPVIIMTAYSDLETTIKSYQSGAFEYLAKPFDIQQALDLVAKAMPAKSERKLTISRKPVNPTPKPAIEAEIKTNQSRVANFSTSTSARESASASNLPTPNQLDSQLLGSSDAMQQVYNLIARLAQTDINVLISGESGTGKELVARALHQASDRRACPFITINTAVASPGRLELALFGREGDNAGAGEMVKGRFEQARGGTLFLDEIGEMPAAVQAQLLRVVSTQRLYRIGGQQPIELDVRIITATQHDLQQRVQAGLFRADLYHRFNAASISLPPLSARLNDVPVLAQHFFAQAARLTMQSDTGNTSNHLPKTLSESALAHLCQYHWPGNVRELENLCQRLNAVVTNQTIKSQDLDPQYRGIVAANASSELWQKALKNRIDALLNTGKADVSRALQAQIDEIMILSALEYTDGHKQQAALALGWGRNTLTRKMQELKL